jgi:hypothetical protein
VLFYIKFSMIALVIFSELLGITSLIRIIAMFLTVDSETIFDIEFVGMCMIYSDIKFHVLISDGILVSLSIQKLNIHLMHPQFRCLILKNTICCTFLNECYHT